jgi:uncharacterized protein (DUF433 family)
MTAQIIDRGRGPELAGTRVTVYRVMDYLREGSPRERIAAELDLTAEQVQAAVTYITAHRAEVEKAYDQILQRVRQANPDWVEASAARSAEELKERILSRHA